MVLNAGKPKSESSIAPAGNHVARLYQIIHIGVVHYEWQGQQKEQDKVRLVFELCNERKAFNEGEEERPYSLGRSFGLTMGSKSHLRPFVEGIIGAKLIDSEAYAFDLEQLLGQACLINVVHTSKNGNTYADIAGASPLPKGMPAPEAYNTPKLIDVDTATDEEIEALPDFIKNDMKSSDNYKRRGAVQPLVDAITSDDNPF